MKQTIVAIIPHKAIDKPHLKSNETFIDIAKHLGEIISVAEFSKRYNKDEIDFQGTFVRVVELEIREQEGYKINLLYSKLELTLNCSTK